jgi:hypothetical protein
MSFDKNYPNRKDHRKPFYGAKAIDAACRNHGGDSWSAHNRTIDEIRNKIVAKDEIKTLQLDLIE